MKLLLGCFFLLYALNGVGIAQAQEWVYSVRPGDSLESIAKRYLKNSDDWNRVQALNGISNVYKISIGMRLKIPFDWLKWQPAPAIVINVSGSNFVTSTTTSKKKKAITIGLRLHQGDAIQTGDNGNIAIQFADKSTLLVRAQSEVILDTVSVFDATGMVDTHLRLKRGSLENKVKPRKNSKSRYRVTTPPGTAAVRGTVFRISADAKIMRSEVLKGGVQIATDVAGPLVSAGFGLKAQAGKDLPKPVKLLPEPDLAAIPNSFVKKSMHWQWPTLDGAINYRVQIASNDSFQTLLLNRLTNHASISVEGFKNGEYAMRVRGIDRRGLEGLDSRKHFSLNTLNLTPQIISIQGQVPLSKGAIIFNWTQPKRASAFHLQLAKDSGFEQLVIDQQPVEKNRFTLSQRLSSGHYYWRVSGINQAGREGVFSDPHLFWVEALGE